MKKFLIDVLTGLAIKLIEKYKPEAIKEAKEFGNEKYEDLKEEFSKFFNDKTTEMIGATVVAVTTAAGKTFQEATDILGEIIPGEKDNEVLDGLANMVNDFLKGFNKR